MIYCVYLLANWNGGLFIRTELFRFKWQSFSAQLIINHKQPDEGGVFNSWCSLISNYARYTRESKSRIVTSKAAIEKNIPSLQILEDETVMCYIVSVIVKVLKVRQFGNWIINPLKVLYVVLEKTEKIIMCDRVINDLLLYRVKGDRNIVLIINRRYKILIDLSCVLTAL
jgi:hypothetical protein